MKKRLFPAVVLGLLIALAVYTGAMAACNHNWEKDEYTPTLHRCTKCQTSEYHNYTTNGPNGYGGSWTHQCSKCTASDFCYSQSEPKCTESATCHRCNLSFYSDYHSYSAVDEVVPTCTTDGMLSHYVCNWCTELFTETSWQYYTDPSFLVIPATGHTYDNWNPSSQIAEAATCTSPARYYMQCDNCDNVSTEYTTSVGSPLDHAWGAAQYLWTDAQGNAGGYDQCIASRVCAYDSAHMETEIASVRASIQPQTCTDPEVTTYSATFNNPALTDQTKVIQTKKALGHSFTHYVSDGGATCTADGTKTAKCDRCTATNTITDAGSALGHSYTQSKPSSQLAQAATCTTPDWYYVQCDNCSYVDTGRTVFIDGTELGHSFINYVSNGNAACTADGTKTAKCVRYDECGKTNTIADTGSALGHSFINYVSDGNAACTADGTKTAKCDRCTVTNTITDAGSALGHHYLAVVTNPTCVAPGFTTYTCARCADTYIADPTRALEHWYALWSHNGDATHSAPCKREGCGYIHTVACAAYPVTADGVDYAVCPVCGEMDGQTLGLIPGTIQADGADFPDHAEAVLRGLKEPFGNVLYALTVAHEVAGEVIAYADPVQVNLPMFGLSSFRLVRADGAAWTDVAFTYENGAVRFIADAAGLYLLLPAE